MSTAPNPLYSPSAVSRLTISFPVVMNPRFGAYIPRSSADCVDICIVSRDVGRMVERTPGARARLDSCIRTLIVSVIQVSDY